MKKTAPSHSNRTCKHHSLENYLAFEHVVFILTEEIPKCDTAKTSKTVIIHYWNLIPESIPFNQNLKHQAVCSTLKIINFWAGIFLLVLTHLFIWETKKILVKPIFKHFPNVDKTNLICGLSSLNSFLSNHPLKAHMQRFWKKLFYIWITIWKYVLKIKYNRTHNKQSLKPASVWEINKFNNIPVSG